MLGPQTLPIAMTFYFCCEVEGPMGSGDTVLQSCKIIRVKRDQVSEAQRGSIQPYWPLTSCVTLGISGPQFPHL